MEVSDEVSPANNVPINLDGRCLFNVVAEADVCKGSKLSNFYWNYPLLDANDLFLEFFGMP
jgi:hypothetical protein